MRIVAGPFQAQMFKRDGVHFSNSPPTRRAQNVSDSRSTEAVILIGSRVIRQLKATKGMILISLNSN